MLTAHGFVTVLKAVARKVERDPDGSGMPAIKVANAVATDEHALAFVLFLEAVAVAGADV